MIASLRRVIAVTSIDEIVVLQRHVAVGFAERAFRLQIFGIDQALDHQFGFGRHQEIDGAGLAPH